MAECGAAAMVQEQQQGPPASLAELWSLVTAQNQEIQRLRGDLANVTAASTTAGQAASDLAELVAGSDPDSPCSSDCGDTEGDTVGALASPQHAQLAGPGLLEGGAVGRVRTMSAPPRSDSYTSIASAVSQSSQQQQKRLLSKRQLDAMKRGWAGKMRLEIDARWQVEQARVDAELAKSRDYARVAAEELIQEKLAASGLASLHERITRLETQGKNIRMDVAMLRGKSVTMQESMTVLRDKLEQCGATAGQLAVNMTTMKEKTAGLQRRVASSEESVDQALALAAEMAAKASGIDGLHGAIVAAKKDQDKALEAIKEDMRNLTKLASMFTAHIEGCEARDTEAQERANALTAAAQAREEHPDLYTRQVADELRHSGHEHALHSLREKISYLEANLESETKTLTRDLNQRLSLLSEALSSEEKQRNDQVQRLKAALSLQKAAASSAGGNAGDGTSSQTPGQLSRGLVERLDRADNVAAELKVVLAEIQQIQASHQTYVQALSDLENKVIGQLVKEIEDVQQGLSTLPVVQENVSLLATTVNKQSKQIGMVQDSLRSEANSRITADQNLARAMVPIRSQLLELAEGKASVSDVVEAIALKVGPEALEPLELRITELAASLNQARRFQRPSARARFEPRPPPHVVQARRASATRGMVPQQHSALLVRHMGVIERDVAARRSRSPRDNVSVRSRASNRSNSSMMHHSSSSNSIVSAASTRTARTSASMRARSPSQRPNSPQLPPRPHTSMDQRSSASPSRRPAPPPSSPVKPSVAPPPPVYQLGGVAGHTSNALAPSVRGVGPAPGHSSPRAPSAAGSPRRRMNGAQRAWGAVPRYRPGTGTFSDFAM